MAFRCGFFNAVNGDRKYNAEDMTNPYKRIVSNGVFGKQNGELSDDMQGVAVGSFEIKILKGQGVFFNKWAELDAEMFFTVPTPDVRYTRIDSIVVKMDVSKEVRAGSINYKTGTPAENPQAPILEDSTYVKEYRLCNIAVAPNTTSITQSNITDTRPTAECGIVHNLLWDSDITATYKQWQAQFDEWFLNLKQTLSTATVISSFTSRYTTTETTATIPINISRYNSVLDILQVYINGMILNEGYDYTIADDMQTITLTNEIYADAVVDFICYKSVDGSEAENVVRHVDDLLERVAKLEENYNQLWSGAVYPAATDVITPSKKLSECKNGYMLVWSDYDETTSTANDFDFNTSFIPKTLPSGKAWQGESYITSVVASLTDSGAFYETYKKLLVHDDKIVGYAGNNVTTQVKDVVLRAIYEF